MTGDDLERILRRLERTVTHVHIVLIVLLLSAGVQLGVTLTVGGC